MVKLLRLTTDNNGKFNADLDAGIEMSENAQIAVQNLTFETTYDVLTINGENGLVSVIWDEDDITSEIEYGQLKPYQYTSADIANLSIDLQGALNNTLEIDTSVTALLANKQNYGEFKLSEDTNTTLSNIQFKLSPLSLPFHLNEDASLRTEAKGDRLWGVSDVVSNVSGNYIPSLSIGNTQVAGDGGINLGNLQQVFAGNNPTADLSHYCYPLQDEGQLSAGSGIFFCNVANVIDNGGDATTNGFGIGLSFTRLSGLAPYLDHIDDDSRNFEIRINRPQDNYSFHNNLVGGTSAVKPHVYSIDQDANTAKHDLMMIERDQDVIRGSICSLNSYSNLPLGNPWTQAPTPATENFDTTDLGEVATYRRVQTGGGAIHWWEAVDATNWNIYLTKPVIGAIPDSTATIVPGTGVITIGATTTTFSPTTVPSTVGGTGGLKRVIFEHRLTYANRNYPMFPYMYFCGGFGTAVAGHPVFTPHCLTPGNLGYEITGRSQILNTSQPPTGGDVNAFELYSAGFNGAYTDVLGNALNDSQFINDTYSKLQNMEISINNEVLRSIGFTVGRNDANYFTFSNTSTPRTGIRITNENEAGYDLIAQNENTLSNSDNYVLMIDSNPVRSYDASKFNYDKGSTQNVKQSNRGRQLNILATIPVNDTNSLGIVEHEANELVYIDLDNQFPQVLKNIRLRILDKNFNEINTIGTSILTLLIKDE